jgi:hypothetical protein
MIWIFGKGTALSIVYDESILREQDKEGGIPLEELPVEEEKEGYYSILTVGDNNEVYWDYFKIEEEEKEE